MRVVIDAKTRLWLHTCLALSNASAKAGLLAELAAELAEDPGGKSLMLHP